MEIRRPAVETRWKNKREWEKKEIRPDRGPAANFQRKRKTNRNEIQRFLPLVCG